MAQAALTAHSLAEARTSAYGIYLRLHESGADHTIAHPFIHPKETRFLRAHYFVLLSSSSASKSFNEFYVIARQGWTILHNLPDRFGR